ncbi:hypothetical protein A3J77_01765 [Candidatus Wolfebacteria bacterium RBG_13_41_7]|uniref:Uncharacterized protein n=1 Tax=Candidatus Wolfebacteria bacterium RBG_13_41_7 TaxID=1802554 RepID=A0A1F8DM66_9BACT|nr:MAG: hypothetical protein A3J77_01765 [Candidatus Wolfebacteria bacterium RBG_13_41_7]
MKNNNFPPKADQPRAEKFKIVVSVFLFFISCFLILNFTHAQTVPPQFLVSWKAQNYVPDWYAGKIFPTAATSVNVDFELIINGKPADLSTTKVRWYVNDKLVKNENNGLGIKKINFITPNYFGQTAEVRIVLADFSAEGIIDKIIAIPVVRPEAVINAPYAGRGIKTGNSIFEVFPFFFNTNNKENFSVQWSVLGQEPKSQKGDPFTLALNIDSQMPAGSNVNLSVVMSNITKALESASQTINLVIK